MCTARGEELDKMFHFLNLQGFVSLWKYITLDRPKTKKKILVSRADSPAQFPSPNLIGTWYSLSLSLCLLCLFVSFFGCCLFFFLIKSWEFTCPSWLIYLAAWDSKVENLKGVLIWLGGWDFMISFDGLVVIVVVVMDFVLLFNVSSELSSSLYIFFFDMFY